MDAFRTPAIVRLGRHDLADIPRVCDHGATGIVVAMATDPQLVAEAIDMTRYQPDGSRSYADQRYGMAARSRNPLDARPAVFAMIEDRRGLEAVEEIAAVPGLSGLHVGPIDLALGLGNGLNPAGASFEAALQRILDAAHRVGIACVLHAVPPDSVALRAAQGFDEVVLPADIGILRASFAAQLAHARAAGSSSSATTNGKDRDPGTPNRISELIGRTSKGKGERRGR